MKRFVGTSVTLLALLVAGCGSSDTPQASTPASAPAQTAHGHKVDIKDFKYKPASLTVKAGTKVKFVNEDKSNHTVTAKSGSFDLGTLEQGDRKSHVFAKAGTYKYFCQFHPFMKGQVVVQPG